MTLRSFTTASLALAFALGTTQCSGQQGPKTNVQKIVIIRHGEKPVTGDNLSCAGLNRALQLSSTLDKKVGTVNIIFVPSLKMGKSTAVARMYQTVVPYAVKHNSFIDSKFDVDDISGLVGSVMKQSGTVLIAWEHKHIHKLLKALGIESADKWDDNDFDSMWIVTFKNGKPELTKDHEGINPSPNCQ